MDINKFNLPQLRLALLLGIAGLLVNTFPIPLFGNVQLVLGNTAIVIAAILLGPWYALVTAVIAATGLMLIWDSPHVYLMFCLEAIWLGYARRRDFYALYASLAYWLFIGIPLLYFYARLFSELPAEHLPFIFLKQGINGLIYAALGSTIITIAPKFWHKFQGVKDRKRRQFSAQLTYSFAIIITLSLLGSALMLNHNFIDKQQTLLQQHLKDSANHLGQATQGFVDDHLSAVNNAAAWLSSSQIDKTLWQDLLTTLNNNYPGFITMLIADDKGHISQASPMSKMKHLIEQPKFYSISDRHYFQEAFYNKKSFISPVFKGRGFGQEPIVAMSAPIFSRQSPLQPIGILEGSLNLALFAEIDKGNHQYMQQSILIVDNNQTVIYASDALDIAPLSHFEFTLGNEFYNTELDVINIRTLDSNTPEFVYSSFPMRNGWSLYVLEPFSPLIKMMEQQYLTMAAILFCAMIATMYVAKATSNRLTLPLEEITASFSQSDGKTKTPSLDDETPIEIYSLYTRLRQSQSDLISHQLELEEKVAIRTYELENVNHKLKNLAEKDALTGLYNRRYAENKFASIQELCERSDEAITIALLDLDHFKQINDTYGHLGGDECLRVVAKLLQHHFKRDSDVIARYGGEEFLLILPLCNPLKVEQHLNDFRQALSRLDVINPQDISAFNVTCSIGALIANANHHSSLEEWLKLADSNLYTAKEKGRNQVITSIVSSDTRHESING